MIHFTGAGPGAPDLITVRGAKLLREADVVIYAGSLVNRALLGDVRKDCEVYDSAKMTLDEVLDVMVRAHEAGKTVVRLHTGDPSLYGATKEQMDALTQRGIPFDVTPGVSSFSAAAAALQAEYTLPGVSQSLVITRAKGRTDVPDGEALSQWAQAGSSMAIFLSAGEAGQVQRELLKGAYSEATPCAVVYRASWEDEKVVRCTLGTLANSVKEAGIEKHALILVGPFLDSDYGRSKLYDPAFETGYRKKRT